MNPASDQDLQLGKWLGGAALGALVMYMLDPDRGAPRRAVSGEKLRRFGRQTGDALDKVVHGIGERMGRHGSAHDDGASADNARHQRSDLRGEAGGQYGESGQPSRWAQDGANRPDGVGSMLRQGADSVGRALSPSRDDGGYDAPRHGASRMRGAALAGASVLGLGGLMAPRSPVGLAMGLAGLALLVRASGRHPVRGMLERASHGHPVEIEKTIRIDAAPEQVFDSFANYENFPRFMSNVIEVRDLGKGRSHWVVKGPAGSHFAWNAVLTEHHRPRRLAWESEPGAEVEQAGAIEFEPIHNGTRVTVRMSYRPPAGAVGHALASLLGRDPKRQMDEDLERMKSLVERGAMAHAGARQKDNFLH